MPRVSECVKIPAASGDPSAGPLRRRRTLLCLALLLTAYAVGLCRQIDEPWIRIHDWNGAFYSQLARNALRYPFDIHHGMPLVAVGDNAAPQDRSIYATHPAGLVWVIAAAFKLFGESEFAARLTAIAASLLSLALLFDLVRRWMGLPMALLAGFAYAIMPLNVFFGRMVNHEPFCMAAMLFALWCWQFLEAPPTPRTHRLSHLAGFALAIFVCAAIDWPGFLFAALFSLYAAYAWRRNRISGGLCAFVWATTIFSCAAVTLHIVYAGLDGSWHSLWSIFTARTGSGADDRIIIGNAWNHTIDNTSLVTIVFALIGLLGLCSRRFRHFVPIYRLPAAMVLLATGVLWVALFWRQYRVHHYWLFYLGPSLALFTAIGICLLRQITVRLGRIASDGSLVISLLLLILGSHRQCDAFFDSLMIPPEYIAAWKDLNRATPMNDRIQLSRTPFRTEKFGDYEFRNITPPQMAWYLDRPFEVAPPGSQPAQ